MKLLIKDQLYALQSLEYDPGKFLKWVTKNPLKFNLEKKKKLVYTGKAKTLLFISSLVPLVLIIVFRTSAIWTSAAAIAYLLAPWLYLISALLTIKFYEIPNRTKTIKDAKRVLSLNPNLIVIGVTGSYGKTTVKEMLKTVLSKKYSVLSTPKSFNTLFGISQIIKEQLKPEHEIFIVEMGAYEKGEIAELCRMVKPRIGIITGISNQHLERFGSEKNIAKAKYELIESLPPDGLAVFNLYPKSCADLYQKTNIAKIGYSRTENPHGITPDILAKIRETSPTSSFFDLKVQPSDGRLNLTKNSIEDMTINLPGEHNVSNTLAAIAVALYLDIPIEQIRNALPEIKSPEHRLQVIAGIDGTIVIDDAYSSNTDGTRAAVNLVKKFMNKPKIIVTPGLVELGKAQFEENKNFGKLIAENFDYAVIVNKTNREAILEGILPRDELRWLLAKQGASLVSDKKANQVFVYDDLEKATKEVIPNLVKPGSLILFENDLPDIYE